MRVHILPAAVLLSFAGSLGASERLSMAVSPAQSFAPTNLTIHVRLIPDDGNRAVEVVAESDQHYRSSRIQLDGAEAPRTIAFEFRNVPGGNYDVKAALLNGAGKERTAVREHVVVIDPGDKE